ncbi:MAG: hypothetical protein IPG45_31870 [Deltaproteobacteria bacterium]|nr:hypothetical protein [Deltaproteobacteria bacterium]
MSGPSPAQSFPKGLLWAAFGMIVLSIGLTLVAKATGFGAVRLPPAQVVQATDVHFSDRADGTLAVVSLDGREVSALPPGSNGFVRGVLRGLARERKLESLGPAAAFRLTRWSDGRLSIEDLATGRRVDLGAFGHTNSQAFADLLAASTTTGSSR